MTKYLLGIIAALLAFIGIKSAKEAKQAQANLDAYAEGEREFNAEKERIETSRANRGRFTNDRL